MMDDHSLILKYFPNISETQLQQFILLKQLYVFWNARINVISRRDIVRLYEHHVLHSLGIAKIINFKPGTKILDLGTGGGFPGIPLAIMFPAADFHLVDSIGKKIMVVKAVYEKLELNNVTCEQIRVEKLKDRFDFIIGRSVTDLPVIADWVKGKFRIKNFNDLSNGILYLKGDEINIATSKYHVPAIKIFHLNDHFEEKFFETKNVTYICFFQDED
ncbi:MAG: 16S rRNA (guanine(527)-N(7))-methyltransferase RsmG [Bacteroidota bacterium]